MNKRLNRRLAVATLPLLWLSLAAGSCSRDIPVQTFPPLADLKAATEPKPRPTIEIVTDPQANERYNAAVEVWGDSVLDAGRRVCSWAEDMGAKLPFECRREAPH
jgi:hypothetical protein